MQTVHFVQTKALSAELGCKGEKLQNPKVTSKYRNFFLEISILANCNFFLFFSFSWTHILLQPVCNSFYFYLLKNRVLGVEFSFVNFKLGKMKIYNSTPFLTDAFKYQHYLTNFP
jgi:hypothetical protein